MILIAIIAFIIGILILLLGAEKHNPSRDVFGFLLVVSSFTYVTVTLVLTLRH